MTRALHALLILVLMSGIALADDPPPKPQDPVVQEEIAVEAWGKGHADCGEWTDLCVVCRRDGDGVHCSTPGIACTPATIVCRLPKP